MNLLFKHSGHTPVFAMETMRSASRSQELNSLRSQGLAGEARALGVDAKGPHSLDPRDSLGPQGG